MKLTIFSLILSDKIDRGVLIIIVNIFLMLILLLLSTSLFISFFLIHIFPLYYFALLLIIFCPFISYLSNLFLFWLAHGYSFYYYSLNYTYIYIIYTHVCISHNGKNLQCLLVYFILHIGGSPWHFYACI
jgi:hypothetical protein